MSLSISSDAWTPSDLATVNCSGFPLAAASTDSEEKVVMKAPFPIELACKTPPPPSPLPAQSPQTGRRLNPSEEERHGNRKGTAQEG